MSDLTTKLCEALNVYCFDNIWNEPQNEFRVNVKPHLINTRSISGGFTVLGSTYIELPTNYESYYVYALHRDTVHGLVDPYIPKQAWISCTDLCNKYDVLLHTYLSNGKIISKASAFIYWRADEAVAYLAIKKNAAMIIGTHSEMNKMYITIYKDSDIVNKMLVHSVKLPEIDTSYTSRQKVWDILADASQKGIPYTVYIDGYETRVNDLGDIKLGTYIDVITDENVVFEFTLDLSDVKNNVGFFSDMDSTYKQLVHIPKELNPTNKVLTHNTMEIHVRSNEDNRGVYLHRCANRTVSQVTHNDFGIPMFVVDATRDTLETQNITLHISVRQHVNDNVLIRDKNYLDLLYSEHHTDDKIISHLLGEISPKLDFWKASNLEKSVYVNMMFDVPDWFTPNNVWNYVEGLGYYHTVSLLCKRLVSTTITDWFTGSLDFSKPYLYSTNDSYPIVYMNGFKVPWDNVTVSNTVSNKLTVGFKDYPWKIGDTMTTELFVTGPNNIVEFSPINGNNMVFVPYTDVKILEKTDLEYSVPAYERVDRTSYTVFNDYIGNVVFKNVEGGCEVTFGPLQYGKTFILQNDLTTYTFSKKIDADMLLGKPIVLDLQYRTNVTSLLAPISNISLISAYLNGRYLTPDVDYSILKNTDRDGNLTINQFVLQNMQYMKETGNTLEVFVCSDTVDNQTYGFVVEDRADTDLDEVTIYFDTLTTFHVNGELDLDPEYRGAYFTLTEDKYKNGVPFHVRTAIPTPIKEFVDKHHTNDDIERIKILNDYFFGNMDDRPGLVLLPMRSHRIYSPHMAGIIRDIINGTFEPVAIDPDINKLLLSLKKYQKFYDNDICHNSKFNTTFLDCYPHYKQYEITDITTRKYINDLIRAVMPYDDIRSGLNVY